MMKYLPIIFFLIFFAGCAPKYNGNLRGTWLTNVGSDAMTSEEKISRAVEVCQQHRINTIYVVTWNNGMTTYPSDIAMKYIGVQQDPAFQGFDPIASLIRHAHKKNIRVIGWFEFGFSYAYKDPNNVWAQKYPGWIGRNKKGEALVKNGFYWWSSLHPGPQKLMQELLEEFVAKYKVDGVQGDDRFPAMPSEGGYDAYTLKLYGEEHNGTVPPLDHKDSSWVQWRADKLNKYIQQLYGTLKQKNPKLVVSWAPSVYPWSKQEYLQDWPAWLQGGYADEVLPQAYRYELKAYENVIREMDKQTPTAYKHKVFPGVLISLADGYQIKSEMLRQMVAINRKYGFKGECTFYFEGLKAVGKYY